jgi:hypothetical protein
MEILSVLWRFVTGAPLDGRRRTDATFLHAGTSGIRVGRASAWSLLPGWQRASWRLGACSGFAVLSAASARWPVATRVASVLLILAAAAYGVRRALPVYRRWNHTRTVVKPLHDALSPAMGMGRNGRRPDTWLHVPEDYADDPDAVIRIDLPAHWADTGRGLVKIASTRLGGSDWEPRWHLAGGRPYVELKRETPPPALVDFAALRPHVEQAKESAPVLGLGAKGRPIAVKLDTESPHVLISAGSGGGKSVTTRGLVAQGLHNGGRAVFLDVKRISHRWARGIPRVEYHRDIESIHNALITLRGEVEARYDEIEKHPDATFQRVYVVAEEMNATIKRLTDYWAEIRDRSQPKTSPAVTALGDILFTGRACRVHVIAIGQMMTARALGGPEARENFAVRILSRFSMNAWRMLAPEVWPAPRSSKHPGRVQVVMAGEAHACQVGLWTEAEAREWALNGEAVVHVPPAAKRAHQGKQGGTVPPLGHTLALVETRYTLREAVDAGVMPLTLAAARKARQRDPEFPSGEDSGQGVTYSADELSRWIQNRPRAIEAGA